MQIPFSCDTLPALHFVQSDGYFLKLIPAPPDATTSLSPFFVEPNIILCSKINSSFLLIKFVSLLFNVFPFFLISVTACYFFMPKLQAFIFERCSLFFASSILFNPFCTNLSASVTALKGKRKQLAVKIPIRKSLIPFVFFSDPIVSR